MENNKEKKARGSEGKWVRRRRRGWAVACIHSATLRVAQTHAAANAIARTQAGGGERRHRSAFTTGEWMRVCELLWQVWPGSSTFVLPTSSEQFFSRFFLPPQVFFVLGFGTCGSLVATIASTAKFPRPSLPLDSYFVGPCWLTGSLFYDLIDSKLLIICCRKKNQIGCCENLAKIVVCLSCPCVCVCVFFSIPFPTILCLVFVFLSDLRVRCSGSLRLLWQAASRKYDRSRRGCSLEHAH